MLLSSAFLPRSFVDDLFLASLLEVISLRISWGVIVQVKSGHVKSSDISELAWTTQREKAALGVFITLEQPTKPMITEALSAGYYESPYWGKFPRIQILTIADLLKDAKVNMPPPYGTFKQAQRVRQNGTDIEQNELFESEKA